MKKEIPQKMDFILASSSPRRISMLADLGYSFKNLSPEIDETPHADEKPYPYVQRMAREKAQAIKAQHAKAVVLASDTSCLVDGEIFGKPEDAADARRMIKAMSGKMHLILTSVACVDKAGNVYEFVSETKVFFRALTEKEISQFIQNVENWQGKAGAYGLQTNTGSALIERIEGSHTGVIGLPLAEVVMLLHSLGIESQ